MSAIPIYVDSNLVCVMPDGSTEEMARDEIKRLKIIHGVDRVYTIGARNTGRGVMMALDGDAQTIATLRADLARVTAALDAALSGESEAVRRAESAELGCLIAYRREPTSAEGDAHEAGPPGMDDAECFVPMGGWTGRRCRACGCWVWGGPTACERCVRREERDEAREERDEARGQRDAARAQVRELQKVARAAVAMDPNEMSVRLRVAVDALPPSMLEEPSDG